MKLYEELLWRNLIKDVSDEELAKELLNNEKIRFYVGYDPTGQSLTIGHLVQIMRMKLLEKHGHTPVVLIGGATGLIGDPRESSERTLLTLEKSLENAKLIEKQISKYLNPKTTMYVNNYDWIKQIDMITFLRDYGKNFNLNYMLSKETIQTRLSTGISYTEFSYMLLQAIDFLTLYRDHNVLIQFGGSDQWGNLTTGLELIRKTLGKNRAVALSSPLLLKSDGEKFGKSEGGAIWLDENLTTPFEMYQFLFNSSDSDVVNYLKSLTLLSREEITELEKASLENPGARLAQKALASEVVKFVHGEEGLNNALLITDAMFTGNYDTLSENDFKALENVFEVVNVEGEISLIEALNLTKLSNSNREAREFINNGAISINNEKITNLDYNIKKEQGYFKKYFIIKRGRRRTSLLVIS